MGPDLHNLLPQNARHQNVRTVLCGVRKSGAYPVGGADLRSILPFRIHWGFIAAEVESDWDEFLSWSRRGRSQCGVRVLRTPTGVHVDSCSSHDASRREQFQHRFVRMERHLGRILFYNHFY